jgi:signal transduction histidine kinase
VLPFEPPIDWPGLPCGLFSFDDAGRLLSINARLRGWLQLPEGGEPGPLLNDLLAPASRPLCPEAVFAVLRRSGHVDDVLLAFQAQDGHAWPGQVSAARHEGAEGAINVAVVVRVADWRQPGQAVVGAQPTAEQLPGLVYQYLLRPDGSTCFPYASEAMHELFGVTPEEARHSAEVLASRVHRDDWPAVIESIHESARTLERWDSEFRVVVNGDVRWLEGRSTPQALPDGSVLWHGYLSDVTARKVLEQSRQGAAVAEEAGRAKSEFLARVSHELRTPLNAVLGFSQLLSADQGLGLGPNQQRQLDHIESAGRSLLALINEVLDLTHIESGRMEVRLEALDLRPVVEESLAMVERLAERSRVALRIQVDPVLRVLADRRKLVQCLVNLLTNAIKYNREGGQVAVVGSSARGVHEVRIDVRDTGSGFTASQMAHLFEPFNRLGAEHGNTEGSGLGLVIVRGLAERQGGRLTVDSEPGQGACFSLHLPVPEDGPPDVPVRTGPGAIDVSPPAGQAGAPRRVLYVEDNTVNVMLMKAIFDLRPALRLDVADTGAEGLAQALADPPALLLLDLGLPDVDGVTLLARLRDHEVLQGIPAVAVSADALSPDIERALSAGFSAYWTKPLDLRRTLEALDALMA